MVVGFEPEPEPSPAPAPKTHTARVQGLLGQELHGPEAPWRQELAGRRPTAAALREQYAEARGFAAAYQEPQPVLPPPGAIGAGVAERLTGEAAVQDEIEADRQERLRKEERLRKNE